MFLKSHTRELSLELAVRSGFSRWARRQHSGEACILTFHGLSDGLGEEALLHTAMHPRVEVFRAVCEHLAGDYHVVPLAAALAAQVNGRPVAAGTVALTFDDGYASNYRLAFPVLRELGLPATVFATTGFLDRSVRLWFLRLELALSGSPLPRVVTTLAGREFDFALGSRQERVAAYGALIPFLKGLAQEQVPGLLDQLELDLQVGSEAWVESLPAPLQPMTWEEAREMQASGLIEFGGHTHTHPILGRCSLETQREEIFHSRLRLSEELGRAPGLFAYPNGKRGDYNDGTIRLLREAGYRAGFTMEPGFFMPTNILPYDLPRYGNPSSLNEVETMASGSFETLRGWKLRWGLAK